MTFEIFDQSDGETELGQQKDNQKALVMEFAIVEKFSGLRETTF